MNKTPIEWTDFSANPLRYRDDSGRVVWACVHASDGCRHCYSEALAKRYAKGGPFTAPVTARLEPFLEDAELFRMLTAKRIGGHDVAGSRCFIGDMTDVFGEWVSDALLDRLFAAFALRPDVTFQVLTKRADRMRAYLSEPGRRSEIAEAASILAFDLATGRGNGALPWPARWAGDGPGEVLVRFDWPLPNVWLGTSCEDQPNADRRIPDLLATPAAVRFLSVEPLLAPVYLRAPFRLGCANCGNGTGANADILEEPWPCGCRYCYICSGRNRDEDCSRGRCSDERLDWVIVGGESGPGARPCDVAWVRSIVQQCKAAGVACFVKQLGARRGACPNCGHADEDHGIERTVGCEAGDGSEANPICGCRKMRGEADHAMGDPYASHAPRDPKGGDPAEWPEDLRVREFPAVRA